MNSLEKIGEWFDNQKVEFQKELIEISFPLISTDELHHVSDQISEFRRLLQADGLSSSKN